MKAKFIYEAFTDEESDPIADMGIGGYSWKTISMGAVIKVRPDRRSVTSLTKNQSGQFTDARSGMQLRDHHYMLVTAVSDLTSNNKKRISFKKYSDDKDGEEAREIWLAGGKLGWGGMANTMEIGEKSFDNRFFIVKNGFKQNIDR